MSDDLPAVKRGPGRPRKALRALTEVLKVRVTTEQADTLYRLAARERTSLSEVLRSLIPVVPKTQPATTGPTLGAQA